MDQTTSFFAMLVQTSIGLIAQATTCECLSKGRRGRSIHGIKLVVGDERAQRMCGRQEEETTHACGAVSRTGVEHDRLYCPFISEDVVCKLARCLVS